MQAVILAAGKSTRTYPLTLTRPKPLLPLVHTTILGHTLDQLHGLVEEAIIIVGYKQEQIRETFGKRYRGIELRYIEQKEQKGTAHALQAAQDFLKDRFVVLNGDDVFYREDIERCLRHSCCLLVAEHAERERFGVVQVNGDFVEDIVEKPEKTDSLLVNTGLYVFDRRVFNLEIKFSERGELEIVDYVRMLDDVAWEKVNKRWIPVTYPWNLLEANSALLDELEPNILGKLEENVHLDGKVFIGKGTVIKSGTYIEGPVYVGENCTIGPGAYLRPQTVILENNWIGFGTEIVDSVILPDCFCKHRSYIGHSVIGRGANIGAGLITADFRHDMKPHVTLVKGKKVDTHRDKLGAFLGDNVMTGVHTSIYPGRKIWPSSSTLPGEIVKEDKTS